MSVLAQINNAEAAKRAARNGTPYVPWNEDEVREERFGLRVPSLTSLTVKGWKLVGHLSIIRTLNLRQAIIDKLASHNGALGLAKLPGYDLGFFEPLPEAHLPGKAEW